MNISSGFGAAKLSPRELDRIASVLREIAGIELPSEKASLVQARLSKRLRHLGLTSYSGYCDLLESAAGRDEKAELLSALTTNVTKFFRENHHFKYIEKNLMEGLAKDAARGRPIRIWSAACSTGEEPYSIAITLLRSLPNAANLNIRIYGTDIDPKVVQHATEGVYRIYPDGPVSSEDLRDYFIPQKGEKDLYAVKPEVKKMVTFSTLNLHGDWPSRGDYDIIFCRNVVIYFNKEREKRIWQKFSKILRPGGHLFIGHSERVPADAGCALALTGVTTYVSTK